MKHLTKHMKFTDKLLFWGALGACLLCVGTGIYCMTLGFTAFGGMFIGGGAFCGWGSLAICAADADRAAARDARPPVVVVLPTETETRRPTLKG